MGFKIDCFTPFLHFMSEKKDDDDDDGCIDRMKRMILIFTTWCLWIFFFVYILHTKNDDLHLHLQTRKWWPGSKCILCILIRSFVCVNERKSVWWIPSENVNVYNSHFVPGVLWWLAISISFFFGLNLHLEIFRSLFEWMKWINES